MEKIFFEIHKNLNREAPGSDAETRHAFNKLQDMPDTSAILDIGCGPGAHTIELSKLIKKKSGTITAVDLYQQYLDTLNTKLIEQNINNITCIKGDMFKLPFPDNSFDVIWSEGAIYIIGFEKGLQKWRPLLKTNGYIVVTEISWLKEDPPIELVKFWTEGYPDMKSINKNLTIAEQNNFQVIDHFTVAENSWVKNYYDPLEQNILSLKQKYSHNPEIISFLKANMTEIDLYKKYSDYYGYEFYILKKKA